MREFGDWVNSMAGSIEDKSEYSKDMSAAKSLSEPAIRAAYADMTVEEPLTGDMVYNWVEVFSMRRYAFDAHGPISSGDSDTQSMLGLVGKDFNDEWFGALTDGECLAWLKKLRLAIARGDI